MNLRHPSHIERRIHPRLATISALAHGELSARNGTRLQGLARFRPYLLFDQDNDTEAATMSQQALNKIAPNSPSRAKPNEIETSIATALYELETNIPDMRAALRPLQFVSAREVR